MRMAPNRTALRIAVAAAVLAVPLIARADPPPPGEEALRRLEEAERSLRDGLTKALDSIGLLLQSLPRYEAPIINEDGDIIIRRQRPQRPPTLRTATEDGMI